MKKRCLTRIEFLAVVTIAAMAWIGSLESADKKYTTLTNADAQEMLNTIQADIKKYYYDPAMHGLNLDKRFEEARQKIAVAKSQDEALLDIAATVEALKDSHTHFRPPFRPYGVDYGWLMQAVGESSCYVTQVRPDSDAAAKGMKPGDQVASINGISLVREDISYVEYSYRVFPQSGFHLVLRSPDGTERPLVVMAKVIPGQIMIRRADFLNWAERHRRDGHDNHSKYYKANERVIFWKLPDFVVDPVDVDGLLNKVRSYDTVVLDLRGNPGGRVDAAEKFIGGFFDHDVTVGDRKSRKEFKPEMAKTRGHGAFGGKLIVLVDSKSKSAAEIFARVVQLEKRGTILGDRSAGAVMESEVFTHAVALDQRRANVTQYGAMITIADLIMADGESIENVGVTPDERIVPTPADMAALRDPVLARAAALAGLKMTPEEAGKIFPFEWPKQRMPEMD
jgi:C-terminal processing protease CtpA/Prc